MRAKRYANPDLPGAPRCPSQTEPPAPPPAHIPAGYLRKSKVARAIDLLDATFSIGDRQVEIVDYGYSRCDDLPNRILE
jgi:hypothetical protein